MEFDYKKFAEEMLRQMPGVNSSVTLTDFAEQVISFTDNNRSKKTCEGVKLVCKKLLNFFPPNRRLDSIELKDAENFFDSIKKNAPKGIYNYHRTLRAMWNKARQWNYVNSNPFEQIKLRRKQMQKPIYVTEEQLGEIMRHINVDVVRDVVITAFYTGCRLGEIVNLTWRDVNLKDELLIIGSMDFETKGRKQRIVPIHPKVKEVLLGRLSRRVLQSNNQPTPLIPLQGGEKRNYVFAKGNGFPFTRDYFSKKFKKACRKAGLGEELHFHCLRHGAATRMIMSGAPLPAVQKILGHANIQTTMIYTHPDLESLRDAVGKL